MIALRFTSGARKICNNIKSQNMRMIVVWNKWFLKDQYWFLSYFFYMSITLNMLQFIAIICVPYCGVINFEIHISLLIKLFSFSEVLVRWNREHSSFLKGSQWSKIKPTTFEWWPFKKCVRSKLINVRPPPNSLYALIRFWGTPPPPRLPPSSFLA